MVCCYGVLLLCQYCSPGVIVTELQKRGGLDDAAYAKV